MKNTRKLIPALAMLLVSAILMSSSSFAWFSMNDSVTATGMAIKATTEGSIVISNDVAVGTDTTVVINTGVNTLVPMTYTTDIGYQFPTSLANIDAATGFDKDGGAIGMTTISDQTGYYIDKVVYLAASGKQIDNKTLTATVTFGNGVAALKNNQKAVTVAFMPLPTTSTAKSTTLVNDVDDSIKVIAADGLVQDATLGTMTLPLNTTNTSVPIIIRIYIDGAAENGGTAYVNTNAGDIADLNIGFEFKIS